MVKVKITATSINTKPRIWLTKKFPIEGFLPKASIAFDEAIPIPSAAPAAAIPTPITTIWLLLFDSARRGFKKQTKNRKSHL